MSNKKQARRAAMGDPSGVSQSNATFAGAPPAYPAQPRPDSPQDGKGGNMRNYEHIDDGMGNTGQMIGGQFSFPYGDMGMDPGEAMARGARGAVGPLAVSGEPQGVGASYGIGKNQNMNSHSSPKEEMARMYEGMHLINSAMEKGQQNGFGNRPDGSILPTPYQPGPMGMHNYPSPLDGGEFNFGQVDFNTPQQSQSSLGLQGLPSAEAAVGGQGMNMGTGQRNTTA